MSPPQDNRNLVLIGFMGTGKSSVGRLIAQQLHYDFIDTDDLIQAEAGKSIPEIFAQHGEQVFRDLEKEVVRKLQTRTRTVVSTGGGLGASAENLASLKQHACVICLWASPEAIFERVRHQNHRPLLHHPHPLTKVRELLETRAPVYRQADALVITEQRSIKEVAQQVLHHFNITQPPA